jgi:hypothetical protein
MENDIKQYIKQYKEQYYNYLKICLNYIIILAVLTIIIGMIFDFNFFIILLIMTIFHSMVKLHSISPSFDQNESSEYNLYVLNKAGIKMDKVINEMFIYFLCETTFLVIYDIIIRSI